MNKIFVMKLINRCSHRVIRGIYGDEINYSAGYRLACSHCGRLLEGPVSLSTWSIPEVYSDYIEGMMK